MRLSAVIDTAQGLSLHDHTGWVFDDPAEFQEQAGRFLTEGLAARQRIMYVAGEATAPAGIPGLDAAIARGQAEVASVAALYTAGEPVDAGSQVATFAVAAEQALRDGWTGLRVAADVTSLVSTERQLDAWIRYEHLADTLMAGAPIAGFCGFHRPAIESAALREVSCVHPVLNRGSSDFRMYSHPGDGALTLAGEIDRGNSGTLAAVLGRTRPALTDGLIVVDATRLTFIDHHGLTALAGYAIERDARAALRVRPHSVACMIVRLMPFPGLEIQVVPA
jgi:anti-anti-sigma regulatory factor